MAARSEPSLSPSGASAASLSPGANEPRLSPAAGTAAEVPVGIDAAHGPAVYQPPVHVDLLPAHVRRGVERRDKAKLLTQEWLLTNRLGGYAMGNALAASARRYHSWLNAATTPPVGRINALASCVETLILEPIAGRTGMSDHAGGEQRLDFSTFIFHGDATPEIIDGHLLHPTGYMHLESFEKTPMSCTWCYRYGPVEVRRELTLVEGVNAAIVRYTISTGGHRARLELRPLVALRDIHGLRAASDGAMACTPGPTPASVEVAAESNRLLIECVGSGFEMQPAWWYGFEYPKDKARGQDYREDLFTPGVFVAGIEAGARERVLELKASLSSAPTPPRVVQESFAAITQRRRSRLEQIVRSTSETCSARGISLSEQDALALSTLVCAADQFVVRRDLPDPAGHAGSTISSASVIAGYPWFADWGRDTMISLRGLLLTTGRLDEARQCLQTFARLRKHGLVPNCFHDSGEVEHNTVDASLWYIHAACDWRREATRAGLPRHDEEILAACVDIVSSYIAGTDFDIKVDPEDGLVTAGNTGTQLTWMDAKRDGVVFTPRHGKPVEINALWYSALCELSDALKDADARLAGELKSRAHVIAKSFRELFWDPARGCLHDVLLPGAGGPTGKRVWWPSPEIRPNQIWAISLPHSPLTDAMQKAVLHKVTEHLLTPLGLRTLSPGDRGYVSRFEGNLFERDRAYHNGTVWPWLIGAYAEGVLRVGGFSARAAADARRAIAPLMDVACGRGPHAELGQIPEIYDADETPGMPRRADGCPMQAWSVAETLRVLWMILRLEAGLKV
ncbi:MAG: amylo-alpha-1,6-glucosidase [Planctomycetota bacterium]|nr:amylo-alpha-1,6-glucosidase [Planctomycetota bacterium]